MTKHVQQIFKVSLIPPYYSMNVIINLCMIITEYYIHKNFLNIGILGFFFSVNSRYGIIPCIKG